MVIRQISKRQTSLAMKAFETYRQGGTQGAFLGNEIWFHIPAMVIYMSLLKLNLKLTKVKTMYFGFHCRHNLKIFLNIKTKNRSVLVFSCLLKMGNLRSSSL